MKFSKYAAVVKGKMEEGEDMDGVKKPAATAKSGTGAPRSKAA